MCVLLPSFGSGAPSRRVLKRHLASGWERGRRTIEFRVLGPVAAVGDDGPITLGAPKQRALLAFLLLNASAVVPRDRLVDVLWGSEPPKSAVSSLQVYVHGLRKTVGPERIERYGAGYRLQLE